MGGAADVQEPGQAVQPAVVAADQGEGDGDEDVEQDVLDHRGREDDAGESAVEEPEVVEDAGDHRDRGDRDPDREDQRESLDAPRRSEVGCDVQEAQQQEPAEERQRGAGEGDERRGLALALLEQGPDLCARAEHEEQEPELIDGAEHRHGRHAVVEDPGLPAGQEA